MTSNLRWNNLTLAARESRIPTLDGARGLALLMVMQYHFWNLAFGLFGRPETQAVDIWSHKLVRLGWSGMDFFFVLSGFLITGILYDAKGRGGYLRTFYGRRALRIVPAYTLFLIVVLFVVPALPLDDGFVAIVQVDELRDLQFWYWTYLLNIGTSVNVFDVSPPTIHTHFWTLAVEEQFYLLWPFAVVAFSRANLMRLCLALAAVALLFRIAIVHDVTFGVFNTNAAFVMMPARMDTLGLGALIALAIRGPEYRTMARLAPAVAAVCAMILALMFIRSGGLQPHDKAVLQYGNTVIALLCASLLVLILETPPRSLLSRALALSPLQTLGRYSYAMYIVHLLISFELAREFARRGLTPTLLGSHIPLNIIFCAIATGMTFVIGWLSWHLLEKHALGRKSWFRYGGPPPAHRSPHEIDVSTAPTR